MQVNFYRCSVGKICENSACVMTQAVLAFWGCVYTQPVLAILEMEYKRILTCTGGLLKTNMSVAVHTDKKN